MFKMQEPLYISGENRGSFSILYIKFIFIGLHLQADLR